MFNLDLIELPSIVRIDGAHRHYETPTGEKYPSVTTVLSNTTDKTALVNWQNRIGHDEAKRVAGRASSRGNNVHRLCEDFVLNRPIDLTNEMPLSAHMFRQLQRFLTANVNDIRASEGALYSHKLKVAGSCDLIANYQGKPAIIDFKTSNRNKRKEWIENYFLQASMYSFMFWEMTGIMHPTIVIAISVEEEDEAQIFVEKASNYIDKAKKLCETYHKKFA